MATAMAETEMSMTEQTMKRETGPAWRVFTIRGDTVVGIPSHFATRGEAFSEAQRLAEKAAPAGGGVVEPASFDLGGVECLILATIDAEGEDRTIFVVEPHDERAEPQEQQEHTVTFQWLDEEHTVQEARTHPANEFLGELRQEWHVHLGASSDGASGGYVSFSTLAGAQAFVAEKFKTL